MRDISNVVLVCPDNDAESRMILLIAYDAGMCVIRSGQGHGATLERERGSICDLIRATEKKEAWIVEMPGVEIEQSLRWRGIKVVIIDHHSYGNLDRSHDKNGNPLPSSLEQLLKLMRIDDRYLKRRAFDPTLVYGVGIMDARFVNGLREAGFTHDEIVDVLNFRRECARAGFPDFDKAEEAARKAWDASRMENGYIVVESDSEIPIRGAVAENTIDEDLDKHPIIISDRNGNQIFVQNVDPSLVAKLMQAIKGHTFSFGEGRCWGVDNVRGDTEYVLSDIMNVLIG